MEVALSGANQTRQSKPHHNEVWTAACVPRFPCTGSAIQRHRETKEIYRPKKDDEQTFRYVRLEEPICREHRSNYTECKKKVQLNIP